MQSVEQPVVENALNWFSRTLSLGQAVQYQFLYTAIAVLVIWLLRFLMLRIIFRSRKDTRRQYHWRKISTYVAFGVGIIVIGRIWLPGFHSLVTFLGLLSAGLAIAMKDPLMNLAGWAFIIWRAPFNVGDRVQIGEQEGDVVDLRIFEFTLAEINNWAGGDMTTGRVIYVPNGVVFTKSIANYSKGGFPYIWNEISVLITFESNWKQAKKLLEEIAARHGKLLIESAEKEERTAAQKLFIHSSDLTPKVYIKVEDSGVLLTLRYLCEPARRRDSEEAVWSDILSAFSRYDDIDFAYPTQRFYDNLREKKGLPEASGKSGGSPHK
ncbi:MAG: mechanosensitive ion channel [Candidatus Euphemobacter frigidus]|nr:mechanosensitive ion channel [Candidatus Euphemobacter frigidus]MDP8276638.1 mechanosensitive ion channel [Candidatus Euphemobacter frigidus]